MPRIPQYEIEHKLPGVGPSIRGEVVTAGAEYGELKQLGGAVTSEAAKFTEALRQAREVNELSNAKMAVEKGFNTLELELETDPDYKTFSKRFETKKNEIWKEASKGISEPAAYDALSREFAKETVIREFSVNRLAVKKEIAKMKGDLLYNIDEATRLGNTRMINEMIVGAVAAGVIAEDDGERRRKEAIRNVDVFKANALIMQDPEAAIKSIMDAKQFPNLDEKTRFELTRSAEIEWERRDRLAEKKVKKIQEDTDRNFLVLLSNDQLTRTQIQDAIKKNELSPSDSRFFLKAIERPAEGKTDPDTFVRHSIEISEGTKDPQQLQNEVKRSYLYGAISKSDFSHFMTKIDSIKKGGAEGAGGVPIKDAYYKRAVEYLKGQVKPSQGLFTPESADASHNLMMATMELDNRIAEARKAGKPVKGNDIVNLAIEIAPNYKMSMAESLQKTRERIKAQQQQAVQAREATKATGKAKTPKEAVTSWDTFQTTTTAKPGEEYNVKPPAKTKTPTKSSGRSISPGISSVPESALTPFSINKGDARRAAAIQVLRDAGKIVNEETIRKVMDRME